MMSDKCGRFIRNARERQDYYTLREAAKELGVSAPYLSDVERGNRTITKKTAWKIADLFGMDYEELLIMSDNMSDERLMLNKVLGVLYKVNKIIGSEELCQLILDIRETLNLKSSYENDILGIESEGQDECEV